MFVETIIKLMVSLLPLLLLAKSQFLPSPNFFFWRRPFPLDYLSIDLQKYYDNNF